MSAGKFITLLAIICLAVISFSGASAMPAISNPTVCGHRESRWISYVENLKDSGDLNVVWETLEREKLPQKFVWLMLVESGGKRDACSIKGASGLWQLTEQIATHYGCFDRSDAESSTTAAARYLRKLLRDFGGDEWAAIVGYNMGGTNYRNVGNPTSEAEILANTVTCLMNYYGEELP